MTRHSQMLPGGHPRKMIWWMECDACRVTISSPEWSPFDLPLDRFRREMWRCREDGSPLDTCPTCLNKEMAKR